MSQIIPTSVGTVKNYFKNKFAISLNLCIIWGINLKIIPGNMKELTELNKRQNIFVITLVRTNNEEQARKDSKYNKHYIPILMQMPKIQAAIDLQRKIFAQDSTWSHLDILTKIRNVVDRCMQEIPTKEKGVFKFDPSNALKGLELYGKYHGMWVENFKHTLNPLPTDNPIEVAATKIQSDLRNLFSRVPVRNNRELIDIDNSEVIDLEPSINENQDKDSEET